MADRRDSGPILLTGAAGRLGSVLRPVLRRRSELRLVDLVEPDAPPTARESFRYGDLRDRGFVDEITRDVSAIVHLAGTPDARTDWPQLIESNLKTTAALLDAARIQDVRRLVIASSIHAIGGANDPDSWPIPADAAGHPCCPYGASKCAIEAMARLYADEVAEASVVCLRLALVTYPVRWREEARAWLADDDLRSLTLAALDAPVGFGTYVGASDCPRPRFDLDNAARELGWEPAVTVAGDGWPDDPPAYPDRCRLWRP